MRWTKEQIEAIESERLLPSEAFLKTDLDKTLDLRDSDPFDEQWGNCCEEIERAWQLRPDLWRYEEELDKLREIAFLSASRKSSQHEVASYISDDFDLLGKANLLGFSNSFLESLWKSYSDGGIPCMIAKV